MAKPVTGYGFRNQIIAKARTRITKFLVSYNRLILASEPEAINAQNRTLAFEKDYYNLDVMDEEKNIELAAWSTPLLGKEVYILSAGYSKDNEFGMGIKREKHYLIANPHFQNPTLTELLVRVFCVDSEEVYQIQFYDVGGFRILDEHGLQEIIMSGQDETDWPTFPTFLVRNHGWSSESPLSFHMGTNDGWSLYDYDGVGLRRGFDK